MSALQEIRRTMQSISDIPSVSGLLLVDKQGDIVENQMPPFFDQAALQTILRELLGLHLILKTEKLPCKEQAWDFDDMQLVLYDMNRGFLLTLYDASANTQLANVRTHKLRKRLTGVMSFPKRYADPVTT